MVINKRKDNVVRISRWLDKEIENYISDKKIRLEFSSKRNFIDRAVLKLLEERGVKIK
ncbi:MAG: hypothetical protein ABIF88_04190 [archaeon]